MRGLAPSSPAICLDFTPQCWQGSSAPQLKRRHCYVARFDYEHKPVFEDGQRLSTRLSNSLLLAEKEQLHARLVAVDVSKPLLKKSVDRTPRHKHTPADKRHSDRARVSLPIREDSVDNTRYLNASDSELFSFDNVPMYEDDEDGYNHVVNSDEMPKHSSSVAVKCLGQVSKNFNSRISCLQAEQELKGVPQDVSVKNSDLFSLHRSNFEIERSNPAEVSMQRNSHLQYFMQTPTALQPSSSESASSRSVENINLIIVNDAHRAKSEYIGHSTADNQDCSHGVVACDLHERGKLESQQDGFGEDVPSSPLGRAFNQLLFARTYKLVALQVSLTECESLAYRLKGHLLNWPRISNIARVDGDDMDWDTMSLWANGKRKSEEGVEDSLYQAVYGTPPPSGQMMKRAKSGEKLSFRHLEYLECISRPGRKTSKEIKEERQRQLNTSRRLSRKYYMVELGDSCRQTEELCWDTGHPLFGFSMERWKGPFRLLLLDPKYTGQSELPMAVKMLLNECLEHGKRGPRREIVPCNLTLFYKYWSMEEILNYLLPSEPLLIKVLGHVAVLQLGEQYSSVRFFIGKVILDKHRPKVKTVINKPETVEGWGLPTFEVLAGNHSLVTSIIENDLRFLVNLATMHWDLELAVERQRLIERFSSKDIVCDVFAGAGALALSSAKKVWRVFANDPNQDALKYLARNVDDNKLHAKVELYNLDGCVFLRKLLAFKRPVLMTQIVFSLPTNAETVKDALKGAFNRDTWPANQPLPTVCVYGYSDAAHYRGDFGYLIVDKLRLATEAIELYSVKSLDSGRWLVCATFQLPETLAFDDR